MRIISSTELDAAAALLLEGEVVAFPTETVYGLGAAIFDPEAIAKIYTAKNRPADNPLIAHVSDFCQVDQIASSLPREFFTLAEHLWPGPLTMLVTKTPNVPSIASAGLPTIGIRMPNHPLALELIAQVRQPLVAPSANLSGRPSATTLEHVCQDFEDRIAAVVDGDSCSVGLESTILDLTHPAKPQILRPGSITRDEIEKLLGRSVEIYHPHQEETPRSPGMKYRHYAPNASISLYRTTEELMEQWETAPHTTLILASANAKLPVPHICLHEQNLYAELRAADKNGYLRILVLCDEHILGNVALLNRLVKASSTMCDTF